MEYQSPTDSLQSSTFGHLQVHLRRYFQVEPVIVTSVRTDTRHSWTYTTPSWVGNDYFCDSGNPGPGFIQHRAYSGDPLWDGKGCPSTSTCCQFNNPPWFCKQLPQAMTDSIEVRICSNNAPSQEGEDILVELIELYIQ